MRLLNQKRPFTLLRVVAPQGSLSEDLPQRHIFSVNPKSEYRNPKQIRITKIQMTETTDIYF
jgi:hypothetical protein